MTDATAAAAVPPPAAMAEPVRMPKGVTEVIPDLLYVGSANAVTPMMTDFGIRRIVRCCDDPFDYDAVIAPKVEEPHDVVKPITEESSKNAEEEGAKGAEETADKDAADGSAEAESNPPATSGSRVEVLDDGDKVAPPATAVPPAKEGEDEEEGDGEEEEEEDDDAEAAAIFRRPLPLLVHHCAMEDTLDFDISKVAPRAIDFIEGMLQQARAMREDEQQLVHAASTGGTGCEDENCSVKAAKGGPAAKHAQWLSSLSLLERTKHDMRHAVYVHCSAGVSRSPTVVLAFMMLREGMSLTDAFELLPDTSRPNPSFVGQLMQLEEQNTGEQSTFDVRTYFLEGLYQLFPQLDEKEIAAEFHRCNGNVLDARNALMKRSMMKIDRHKTTINSLHTMMKGAFTMEEVERVYNNANRQRDAALMELMKMETQAKEREEQERLYGPSEKSTI